MADAKDLALPEVAAELLEKTQWAIVPEVAKEIPNSGTIAIMHNTLAAQAARIKELEAYGDAHRLHSAIDRANLEERRADKAETRCAALEMENSGLESALAGEKAAREHDRSVRWALPENLVDGCPEDIRALGWAVAVHNDYQLDGVNHTFWLFTKSDRCTKGEGLTDAEALNEVRAALRAAGE